MKKKKNEKKSQNEPKRMKMISSKVIEIEGKK